MTTLDLEKTKWKFSPAQFISMILVIVSCTATVINTLNGLRNDIREANHKAEAHARDANAKFETLAAKTWTVDDQNRWVWFVNRANAGKFTLPYPVEVKNTSP